MNSKLKNAGKRTALLLIDIQNDYFPGGKLVMHGAEQAAGRAKLLLAHFRKNSMSVIHIRHENTVPAATFFITGTTGADIHPVVAPMKSETVILKHHPDSFIGTSLEAVLAQSGIDDLVICGMQSNICIKSTSLDAVIKKFAVGVAVDAIAARSEEIHRKAVDEMKAGGVEFVLTESIVKEGKYHRAQEGTVFQ